MQMNEDLFLQLDQVPIVRKGHKQQLISKESLIASIFQKISNTHDIF